MKNVELCLNHNKLEILNEIRYMDILHFSPQNSECYLCTIIVTFQTGFMPLNCLFYGTCQKNKNLLLFDQMDYRFISDSFVS